MKEGKTGKDPFMVVLLGIIFDPQKRKIVIGKREKKDPHIKELTWVFPGGRAFNGEELEKTLKEKIKEKNRIKGRKSWIHFLLIYYLCEVIGGKEKPGRKFSELKWVKPEELEKHFTTSFHPHLKEYILSLK